MPWWVRTSSAGAAPASGSSDMSPAVPVATRGADLHDFRGAHSLSAVQPGKDDSTRVKIVELVLSYCTRDCILTHN